MIPSTLLAWSLSGCSSTAATPAPAPVERESEPSVRASRDVDRLAYVPGRSGVTDATFSTWWIGARLSVAVDGANLRAAATADAPVVTALDLAQEVEVLEIGAEPTLVVERRNVWIRVRAGEHEGFLFGALLSPLTATVRSWTSQHAAVVSFSPDFRPRIRVRDGERVETLDLTSSTGRVGGRLRVRAESWGPIEQLGVAWCDADDSGCERLAIRRVGRHWIQAGAEPWPLHATQDPVTEVFPVEPQVPQLVDTVVYRFEVRDPGGDDGPTEVQLDVPCHAIGHAADGTIVSCDGTPWDVGQSLTRFIVRGDGWWYAPNASWDPIEELVDDLSSLDVTVAGTDPTVALPPPYLPAAVLVDDDRGKALFSGATSSSRPLHGEVIGTSDPSGPVFDDCSCSSVEVQVAGGAPDGPKNESTMTSFEYLWKPKTTHLTRADRDVCVHPCLSWRMWDFNPANLEPVDSLGASPVYRTGRGLIALDSWDRPFLLDVKDCR